MTTAQSKRGGAVNSPSDKDSQRKDPNPSHPTEKPKKQLDKELDNALMDSFPASDPPAPSQPTGTEPAGDPRTKP